LAGDEHTCEDTPLDPYAPVLAYNDSLRLVLVFRLCGFDDGHLSHVGDNSSLALPAYTGARADLVADTCEALGKVCRGRCRGG
jgi:hypothetical protein